MRRSLALARGVTASLRGFCKLVSRRLGEKLRAFLGWGGPVSFVATAPSWARGQAYPQPPRRASRTGKAPRRALRRERRLALLDAASAERCDDALHHGGAGVIQLLVRARFRRV